MAFDAQSNEKKETSDMKVKKTSFGEQIQYALEQYGVHGQVAANLLAAFDNVNDTVSDVQVFLENKAQFEAIKSFLEESSEISDALSGVVTENVQNTQVEYANRIEMYYAWVCDNVGWCNFDETGSTKVTEAQDLETKYKALEKTFAQLDNGIMKRNITEEGNKLLEKGTNILIIKLFVDFKRIYDSINEMVENNNRLVSKQRKIRQIYEDYIKPIAKALMELELEYKQNKENKENTENKENDQNNISINNTLLKNKKISLDHIKEGITKLKMHEEDILELKEEAGKMAITRSADAIFNGLGFIESIYKMVALKDVTSASSLLLRSGIATGQLAATIGHSSVAVWGAWNWKQWKQLSLEIEQHIKSLQEIQEKVIELQKLE